MLNISSDHSFNDFKIGQRSNEIKDHAHIYHIYQISNLSYQRSCFLTKLSDRDVSLNQQLW